MVKANRPNSFTYLLGVIFPIIVIIVELLTGLSSSFYFAPFSSPLHFLLVAAVPLSNLVVWHYLGPNKLLKRPRLLAWFNAISIGVAFYYSIVYLPMLPVGIIGVIFGIGLLVFAPIAAFFATRSFRSFLLQHSSMPVLPKYQVLKSVILVFFILTIIDIPKSVSLLGMKMASSANQTTQQNGFSLISTFGSIDTLVKLSYGHTPTSTSALELVVKYFIPNHTRSEASAQTVLFKATGKNYLDFKLPQNDFVKEFLPTRGFWDDNLASDTVGKRLPKLRLISSTFDGDINTDLGYSYVEWTLEVQNDHIAQQEARFQLQLPPQAVISRVTLWVNDEPQEAAFAATSRVKEAYQSVVRRRLDPFLVTSSGPQRIMLQAFPVPRKGGKMKFKIGITTALSFKNPQSSSTYFPQLIERNFEYEPSLNHSVWLESSTPFSLQQTHATHLQNTERYRLRESLDKHLIEQSQLQILGAGERFDQIRSFPISLEIANTVLNDMTYSESTKPKIELVQQLVEFTHAEKQALTIVVDASSSINNYLSQIQTSFGQIPNGKQVNVIMADGEMSELTVNSWKSDSAAQVSEFLSRKLTNRGYDNAPALIKALLSLENRQDGQLLWIHGTQPIVFDATTTQLEQTIDRLQSLPSVAVYSTDASINKAFSSLNWLSLAQQINQNNNVANELGDYFKHLFTTNTTWKMLRHVTRNARKLEINETKSELVNQYNHMIKLWAFNEIKRLIAIKEYEQAGKLGEYFKLVTPVTGAVVLETKAQYEEHDLQQATIENIAKVSTPKSILFILLGLLFMFVMNRQNQANVGFQ